jgi:hypothetical protein
LCSGLREGTAPLLLPALPRASEPLWVVPAKRAPLCVRRCLHSRRRGSGDPQGFAAMCSWAALLGCCRGPATVRLLLGPREARAPACASENSRLGIFLLAPYGAACCGLEACGI